MIIRVKGKHFIYKLPEKIIKEDIMQKTSRLSLDPQDVWVLSTFQNSREDHTTCSALLVDKYKNVK